MALDKDRKTLRQLPNYLLFGSLGVLCVVLSFSYAIIYDKYISDFISNLVSESGQLLLTICVLVILWFIALLFLAKWVSQMRECFGAGSQAEIERQIKNIIESEEKQSNND